jgi:hypothetical protein
VADEADMPDGFGLQSSMVLYLDFDGVLHDDAVYSSPQHGIYIATPGRVLFEWAYILADLLAPHPDVKIVLATSWVRERSYNYAKGRLPAALRVRVIGATFHNRLMRKSEFDQLSRGAQVLGDVDRRRPDAWLAIDNDPAGWPDAVTGRLVLTRDRLGLSEELVQNEIKSLLNTRPPSTLNADMSSVKSVF